MEEANLIGRNRFGGIAILGQGTNLNVVAGNYIGVDVTGEIALPNGATGTIDSSSEGDDELTVNLVDEDFDNGDLLGRTISFTSGVAQGVSRRFLAHNGNTITIQGVAAGNPVANNNYLIDGFGVLVDDGSDNLIGGTETGEGNHIALNLGAGVAVTTQTIDEFGDAGRENAIVGNSIHTNGGIGIDLGRDGFTTNDNYPFNAAGTLQRSDVDEGGNHLQNTPELGIRDDKIEGTLHTEGSRTLYRIEFFSSKFDIESSSDPVFPHPFQTLVGHEFLDSITVRTDSTGYASFQAPASVTFPSVSPIEIAHITATATEISAEGDLLSTSEFSAPARDRSAGVTVVVHGFQLDGDGNSLRFMGREILNLTGGELIDYDEPKSPSVFFDTPPDTVGNRILGSEFITRTEVRPVGTASTDENDREQIFVFDWGSESNNDSEGWGEHAGDVLFAMMVGLELLNPAQPRNNPEYHFIAHSMGTAVTSETVERMATYDVTVEHVTYLDPHDFNQDFLAIDGRARLHELGLPQFDLVPTFEDQDGYGATRWTNIDFLARIIHQELDELKNHRVNPCV